MKRINVSILVFFFVFSISIQTAVANESKIELAKDSKSAILIERDTGKVLYEKNSKKELPPASMTKIMSMLLIMEAIEDGKIKLDDKVRASEYAASMGGSQIFLEEGEEMTVKDLLKGVAIASGNDATVALAEKIAGSAENFVKMMNDKAKDLGLKNTKFQNATGLPAENHYSSAHDMAIMSKELLKYELITKFTGIYEDYLRKGTEDEFWLVNTNRLVKFYDGVDGLKTGFTSEAKYCLTATAKKGDMRVIAVIMGAPTPKERNAQVTQMLDFAFSNYEVHPVLDRHQKVTMTSVSKGKTHKVDVVTAEKISLLTKKGQKIDDFTKIIDINKSIEAPIKKGDEIGTITIQRGNEILAKSSLTVTKDIQEASWWELFKRSIGKFTQVTG